MNRILTRFAVLPLAAFFAAAPLTAQEYPAEPRDGVADLAGIIGPADADSLRAMLTSLRTDAGVEVRVLTVQNIARYGTSDPTPEAFATSVYNAWKLGLGQRQDGVLVLVSVDDRFARIELGNQVPAHQDARMQDIIDTDMVPHFRQGNYDDGVMNGVRALAQSFRDPDYAASPEPAGGFSDPQPVYDAPPAGMSGDTRMVVVLVGLVVLVFAVVRGPHYLRHRKRRCARCGKPMQRLDEKADDVHLDSGRQLEEVLGSVDYDVWQCTGCSHHQVLPYPTMTSGKQECPSCAYQTVTVTVNVLEHATYEREGRERVAKNCGHCGWSEADIIYLPREEPPRAPVSHSHRDERRYTDSETERSEGGWLGGGGDEGGSGSSSSGGSSGGGTWLGGEGGGGSGGSSGGGEWFGGGGSSGGSGGGGGSSSGRGASGRW